MDWYKVVWDKATCPKMAKTTMKAIKGRLPTMDRLQNWGIIQSSMYVLCNSYTETHQHLFFECTYAKQLLDKLKIQAKIGSLSDNLTDIIEYLCGRQHKVDLASKMERIAITIAGQPLVALGEW